ncbi:MAG TPA: hypothetical protein PKD32_02660 [Saprospiraceae bacterium]|jgi:hypothetical protein|nr:hypothetical protein [Saprospiraceae bacterium]MBK7795827.1 hypothetical protein [Saprospiraceae bacterium]MBK9379376.1 hypothetical protein [Saprospiraceae bacterium]HMS28732.1 hypothetical protein [Saprospiraceae bacterium]
MTLRDFFDWVQQNPSFLWIYFLGIPALAFLAGVFAKDEAYLSPWKNLYSFLIYAVTIPGIFAVTLNVYFFFFERRSIMDSDLLIQVFPILSMIFTLWLIRRQVDLDYIPGFDKLSGLAMIIGIILTMMWVLDRTHIYSISFMPFPVVLLLIVAAVLLVRFFTKKLVS